MKPELKNTTILITGASSGMGKEIAKQLAVSAREVILVARSTEKLEQLALQMNRINPALAIHIKPCDLADKKQLSSLIAEIQQQQANLQLADIDILINAAGTVQIGFLYETNFNDIENIIKINIRALSALTHAFLPRMIKNNSGGILNFSSYFGLKVMPAYSAYAGSKHFVTGFSDSLRAEVAGTNVVVSTVYPGPVYSAFWNVANARVYSPPDFLFITLQQCVYQTLKGFKRGKARIIPGFRIKLLIAFLNLSPEPIVRLVNEAISRLMQSKYKKSLQTKINKTAI